MRKVIYDYQEMNGTRPSDWLTDTGWFHKFVVVREDDRNDEVYAIIETKQGKIVKIPFDHVTFTSTPLTSDS